MKYFAALLLVICLNPFVFAKAPVWHVSKDDQTFYLGGTIHLLSESDYPLPEAFDIAFAGSELVVFETDIESANSLTTQAKFMSVLMLPAGKTLKDIVSDKTYAALVEFTDERNLPLTMFERFTPAGFNLTLVVLELQRLGISGNAGVETYFNGKAKTAKKPVQWLESIDEQVGFINRMNELDADTLIMSTIRDSNNLAKDWESLLGAWREGNVEALEKLAITKMLSETPAIYEFILAQRNRDWMDDIQMLAATPEIEFIMVGALHLAGEDSVIKMLEKEGFKVKQLD